MEEIKTDMNTEYQNKIKEIIENACKKVNETNSKYEWECIKVNLKNIYPTYNWHVISVFQKNCTGFSYAIHKHRYFACRYKNYFFFIFSTQKIENQKKKENEFGDIGEIKSQLNEKREELEKNNSIIKKLKIKLDKKNEEIISLEKRAKEKEVEINKLKSELYKKKEGNSFNNNLYSINQILALNFTSMDQKIHYAIPCVGNDIFVDVEKKLYDIYPEYKETNNIFLSNGKTILRFKTIHENNLESGFPIILYKPAEK